MTEPELREIKFAGNPQEVASMKKFLETYTPEDILVLIEQYRMDKGIERSADRV